MTEVALHSIQSWRNFSTGSPIEACALNREDLKRLYDIINEKQLEHARRIIDQQSKQPSETDDQYQQRRSSVRDALVTVISITGSSGETVSGSDKSLFDSATVPERIASILIDTSLAPTAILKYTPTNRASVLLDFSRPTLFNFGVTPSAPTQNKSNYSVVGDSEAWVTSLNTRIRDFFQDRKTNSGWIHKQGCYDSLLMFIGLPITLWASYRVGVLIPTSKLPNALATAVYVYLFFGFLNIFRMLFSYTRWVFPLVESNNPRGSWPQRHRAFWWAILIAIAAALIYDVMRSLVS